MGKKCINEINEHWRWELQCGTFLVSRSGIVSRKSEGVCHLHKLRADCHPGLRLRADCNQHTCFWSCYVFAMTVYVVRSHYSFAEQTQCLKFGIIYRRIINETFPLSYLLIFTSMEQNHWTWHNDQCWSWILWYPLFFKKGDMFAETEGVFT